MVLAVCDVNAQEFQSLDPFNANPINYPWGQVCAVLAEVQDELEHGGTISDLDDGVGEIGWSEVVSVQRVQEQTQNTVLWGTAVTRKCLLEGRKLNDLILYSVLLRKL